MSFRKLTVYWVGTKKYFALWLLNIWFNFMNEKICFIHNWNVGISTFFTGFVWIVIYKYDFLTEYERI